MGFFVFTFFGVFEGGFKKLFGKLLFLFKILGHIIENGGAFFFVLPGFCKSVGEPVPGAFFDQGFASFGYLACNPVYKKDGFTAGAFDFKLFFHELTAG